MSKGTVLYDDNKFVCSKTGWFLLNDPSVRVNMDFNHDVNYLGMFYLEEALRCLGVVGRVVWFRFFVRVVVGRGCVWCVVGVCAASRSALRDPPAVVALSAPCCGIRPRLRRLARHCAT